MDSPLRAQKQAAVCAMEAPTAVAKKFKTQPSAGKLMLTVFWDSQGPILETYQETQLSQVQRIVTCFKEN